MIAAPSFEKGGLGRICKILLLPVWLLKSFYEHMAFNKLVNLLLFDSRADNVHLIFNSSYSNKKQSYKNPPHPSFSKGGSYNLSLTKSE